MSTYAVTAVGPDAPGEVAALTEALAGLGANLQDASMTRLRGHFAMTLIAVLSLPVAAVELALAAAGTGLTVAVWPVAPDTPVLPPGQPYRLSAHGPDQPGLVAAVARVVADAGGNITDLTCRATAGLYVISLELDLPAGSAPERARALAAALGGAGLQVHLEPVDADVL